MRPPAHLNFSGSAISADLLRPHHYLGPVP
jgi:hypothetical protein